ncbi:MAG: ABC transporter substrate-binding protein [Myxococcales bacterium]|nr:ABC transporter substrate-binding protein [Myxococcales bacterium]
MPETSRVRRMRVGVFDDMGRKLMLAQPVNRVISLVPSDTETLFDLGVGEKVVGRTRYCIEPAFELESIPVVGGTKDIDVDAILALKPDLVLANQEENSRAGLEALAEAGAPTFVSFPKRYNDAIAHLARIARFFGAHLSAEELLRTGYEQMTATELPGDAPSVFVPIWRDPLMTFGDHTYCHDILQLAGAANVFVDRERQYPLKADLGMSSPLPADQLANRDRRYPRITEQELVSKAPEIMLLPNEPYGFGQEDKAYFESLDVPAAKHGRVVFVDGKDLFWPGSRSVAALPRFKALISEIY